MNLEIFINLLIIEKLQAIALHTIDLKTGFCSCNNIKCTAAGKHPKTFWRGKRNKLTGNEIRTLFSLSNTNFGVCTGWNETKKRNLVVVDIDSTDHDILNKMPKTFGYRTGKLGYHFWFWTEKQIKNSVSLVDEKVDVRATGGYVVVPNSLHKSGNYYSFDDKVFGEKILDLPDWIYELTKKETKNLKIKKETKTSCSKAKQQFFESISAFELKEKLHNNSEFKISEGTRNQTMFRILCLERSRGADKDALLRQAMVIYSKFENKENFSKNEINNIVNSAFKYIPSNTKYKRVNEGYVKWMEKNKIAKPENFLSKLIKLDNDFFSCLTKSNNGVSLESLLNERINFFKKCGIDKPSNYTTDYFSRKLKDLGFVRKRTKSCNLWLISVDMKLLSDIVANMTTETTTKVKIKVKEHPRSMFYCDKQTSEYTMSSLKYLSSLTKNEGKLLQEGKLVKNKDNVKKFINEVQIDDIIGYKFSHYKVVSKDLKNGLVVTKLKSTIQDSISISDIDFGQHLDRCEILYRNDKPYGIDEFKEVNLIVKK